MLNVEVQNKSQFSKSGEGLKNESKGQETGLYTGADSDFSVQHSVKINIVLVILVPPLFLNHYRPPMLPDLHNNVGSLQRLLFLVENTTERPKYHRAQHFTGDRMDH